MRYNCWYWIGLVAIQIAIGLVAIAVADAAPCPGGKCPVPIATFNVPVVVEVAAASGHDTAVRQPVRGIISKIADRIRSRRAGTAFRAVLKLPRRSCRR